LSKNKQMPSLGGDKSEGAVKGASDDKSGFPDSKPEESSSITKMPASGGGIEVIALRAGFFKQARKEEGDKFKVSKMENLGNWMKCLDPEQEEEHQDYIKAKKKKKKLKEAGK